MAKEILKDEILKDEELDNVAGGTYLESSADAIKFKENGVDLGIPIVGDTIAIMGHDEFVKLREAFNKYGVTIKDKGGLIGSVRWIV